MGRAAGDGRPGREGGIWTPGDRRRRGRALGKHSAVPRTAAGGRPLARPGPQPGPQMSVLARPRMSELLLATSGSWH